MTGARRNALGVGPVLAGFVVGGLCSYGFLVVSARALGPERYGRLSALWALVVLLGPGFYLPLEQELARALAVRRVAGAGTSPVIVRVGVVGAALTGALLLATALGAVPLRREFFDGDTVLLLALALSLPAYCAAHLVRGIFSGTGRLGAFGLVVAVEAVVRLAGAAALAAAGVRAEGAYGLLLAAGTVAGTLVVLRHRDVLAPGPAAPWAETTRALGSLLASSVLAQLLLNAAPLAVKAMATPAESALAGRFLAALLVARIPLYLFQAVQAVLVPRFAALAASDPRRYRAGVVALLAAVAGVVAVITLGALVAGPAGVSLLFGEAFSLPAADLALLAAATGAYIGALALAQTLVAVAAYGAVVTGWAVGLAVLAAAVAVDTGLLRRVELAFLAGSAAAAVVFALAAATRPAPPGAPRPGTRIPPTMEPL